MKIRSVYGISEMATTRDLVNDDVSSTLQFVYCMIPILLRKLQLCQGANADNGYQNHFIHVA